jgi:hypothetical protein
MFSSRSIRLSDSVLVALRGTTQALEILTGKRVILSDVEIVPGKITREDGIGYRKVRVKGCAYTLEQQGVMSPPFQFEFIDIPEFETDLWRIQVNRNTSLMIDNLVTNGKSFHNVRWVSDDPRPIKFDLAVVYITQELPSQKPPAKSITGRSWKEREERPLFQ